MCTAHSRRPRNKSHYVADKDDPVDVQESSSDRGCTTYSQQYTRLRKKTATLYATVAVEEYSWKFGEKRSLKLVASVVC